MTTESSHVASYKQDFASIYLPNRAATLIGSAHPWPHCSVHTISCQYCGIIRASACSLIIFIFAGFVNT